MEMTQPPVPHLGIGDWVPFELLGVISVRTQVQHERVEVAAFASWRHGDVESLYTGIFVGEEDPNVRFGFCHHREQVAPNPGRHHNIDPNEELVAVILGDKFLQHAFLRTVQQSSPGRDKFAARSEMHIDRRWCLTSRMMVSVSSGLTLHCPP